MPTEPITPDKIKAIRQGCGENTATFGERLACSGRTIEDWEQGRRKPSGLAVRILREIEAKTAEKQGGKKLQKSSKK